MIDLRYRELPSAIEVCGIPYPVKTDFRVWLAWGESYEVNEVAEACIWDGIVPKGDWVKPAVDFYQCQSVTPRGMQETTTRLYDLVRDGDYIVGSFQSAYGIDLTDRCLDMHWFRFMALFRSLPQDTKMTEIMGYRGYKRGNDKAEAVYQRQRKLWTLPAKRTAQSDKMVDWQMKAFGKIKVENGGD